MRERVIDERISGIAAQDHSGTSRVRICRSVASPRSAPPGEGEDPRILQIHPRLVEGCQGPERRGATTSRPARCEPSSRRQVDALAQCPAMRGGGGGAITGFERRVGLTGPREGHRPEDPERALAADRSRARRSRRRSYSAGVA